MWIGEAPALLGGWWFSGLALDRATIRGEAAWFLAGCSSEGSSELLKPRLVFLL
jgi:hypothetical protein